MLQREPRHVLSSVALIALIAASSAAQQQPAAAPPTSNPAPASGQAGASGPSPSLPQVTDAMLEPVAPPKNVLHSWQQGVLLIRAQSTNVRTLLAQVETTRAQARQALAPMMPTLTATVNANHHLLLGEGTRYDPVLGAVPGSIPYPQTTAIGAATLRVPLFAPRAWYDRGTALDNI